MSKTPLTPELMEAAYALLLGRAPEAEGLTENAAEHFKDVGTLRKAYAAYPEVRRSVYAMLSGHIPFDVIRVSSGRGFDIHINLNDTGVSREIFLFDEFEPHNENYLLSNLNPNETFIDIGANVGWFTMIAAQAMAAGCGQGETPAGRILCFEANMKTCKMLSATVNGSPHRGFIDIYNVALAPGSGVLKYEDIDVGNIGGGQVRQIGNVVTPNAVAIASKYKETADAFGDARHTAIAAASLDSLLEDYAGRIGLIKIDVEGSEPYVLQGAAKTLTKHRPQMLIEFHKDKLEYSSNYSVGEMAKQLFDMDYEVFDFKAGRADPLSADDLFQTVSDNGYYDFIAKPRPR